MDKFSKSIGEYFQDIQQMFKSAIENNVQDIILVSGERPVFKINGSRRKMHDLTPWVNETYDVFLGFINYGNKLLEKPNTPAEAEALEEKKIKLVKGIYAKTMIIEKGSYDCNFSFGKKHLRCHMITASPKGKIGGKVEMIQPVITMRVIPKEIPDYSKLNLPSINPILTHKKGLVLFAGDAGVGKSTSVASLVNIFNQNEDRLRTILTLEEPVEFVHQNKNAVIIQRRVGKDGDVPNYTRASTDALREDIDIVVLQELREESEINNAIRLVETGKLVIASIHSRSVAETFDRILGEFKAEDKEKTKARLVTNLLAIVHQTLITHKGSQYPLVNMLIVNNDSTRDKLRNALKSPNYIKQIEGIISDLPNSEGLNLEQGFNFLVSKGILTEEDRQRFF